MKAPRSQNYAAVVVALQTFIELPGMDNVRAALIFNNSVILSKTHQLGELGLYFPPETQLSHEFLSANNLYRKPEWGNADPNVKGFFEQHGRVKAVKFRGYKSEGIWLPVSSLLYIPGKHQVSAGDVFDYIGDHEICRKFVPPQVETAGSSNKQNAKSVKKSLEVLIVPGQFRFHYDTSNLRRNAHRILPTDFISITDKWHGTSVVIGKVLVKRDLKWYERLAKKLGVAVVEKEYGLTYSSRTVIKAAGHRTRAQKNPYYAQDIYGTVAAEVEDRIPNGYTIYGEIVGYTTEGKPIQGKYHYGCEVGKHELRVYRVTSTNADGKVIELSWQQVLEFCAKYGLLTVPTLFVGRASDFSPELAHINVHEAWQRESF